MDQLDHLLDLGIFLQVLQENKLNVLVAFEALRLFIPNVELEDLLRVPLDPLSVWIPEVGLNHDGEKRAEVVDCLFHTDVIDEELEAENSQLHRVLHFNGQAEHIQYLDD